MLLDVQVGKLYYSTFDTLIKFGFKYYVELSIKSENCIGSDEDWEVATNGLREAVDDLQMEKNIDQL